MEQTVTYATETFLRDSLTKATLQVSALQEAIENKDALILSMQERSSQNSVREYAIAAEINKLRTVMQEWTLEAMSCGTLNESEAEEIAEICGFELTKEFELEVTVIYSITINAKDEDSARDSINDIDFDSVSDCQGVTYLSASVDRVDI